MPQGHFLVLQDRKVEIKRYWDLKFKEVHDDERDLSLQLYNLLRDAVRIRLISDVPLGMFLSGGVDSTIILGLMSEIMEKPVNTFSIGFEDPSYNELKYARMAARHFHSDHHELVIKPNVVDLVDSLMGYLDEPMADVSIFPTFLVSQLARRDVTVVLSGDGGDELFAGYDWYVANKIEKYYRALPVSVRKKWLPWIVERIPPTASKKGFLNKMKRFVEGAALPESLQHFRWNLFLTDEARKSLYSADMKAAIGPKNPESRLIEYLESGAQADGLWKQQYADINTFLVDDILVKVDRMSMAHSLEVRNPFLDYRVVEFATQLPPHLKLNGLKTKYLLKRSMDKVIPREILVRKKEGFSIPIKNWLKKELRPLMEEYLSENRLKRDGLFNVSYVERLKAEHLSGVANHSHRLWPLTVFQIWRERFAA